MYATRLERRLRAIEKSSLIGKLTFNYFSKVTRTILTPLDPASLEHAVHTDNNWHRFYATESTYSAERWDQLELAEVLSVFLSLV